jgi:hypothetical protein
MITILEKQIRSLKKFTPHTKIHFVFLKAKDKVGRYNVQVRIGEQGLDKSILHSHRGGIRTFTPAAAIDFAEAMEVPFQFEQAQ